MLRGCSSETGLNFSRDVRCGAAAEMGLYFEAIEFCRIVAGGKNNPADQIATPDLERDIWCGIWTVEQIDLKSVPSKYFRGRTCKLRGEKAHVVADHNALFTSFDSFEVFRSGLCGDSYIFKGKGVCDYRAPAVGAKFNGRIHLELGVVGYNTLVAQDNSWRK